MKKKIIAFVPIKLDSKRLKNKNILDFLGKPLCYHIFENLLKVKYIDKVYVYCSDEKIKNYIPDEIIFKKRPKELDGEYVKGLQIYKSFASHVDSDYYLLCHATSPLLSHKSINSMLYTFLNDKLDYDSALSVQKISTFCWFSGETINFNPSDIPRTQDIEPVFVETSGFYLFSKNTILRDNKRVGDNPLLFELDFFEGYDIDTVEDFELIKKININNE